MSIDEKAWALAQKTDPKSLTGWPLTDVLARLGWRHEPGHPNAQGRDVYDESGKFLGQLTANETWGELRRRGLVG